MHAKKKAPKIPAKTQKRIDAAEQAVQATALEVARAERAAAKCLEEHGHDVAVKSAKDGQKGAVKSLNEVLDEVDAFLETGSPLFDGDDS